MIDKKLKKQFEQFGVEYTQAIDDVPEKKESPIGAKLNVVKNIMNTMEGRAWMCSKLVLCGINAQSYVPERPIDTAFQCGLREIGLHLQQEIMLAAPDKYFLMIQESGGSSSDASEQV